MPTETTRDGTIIYDDAPMTRKSSRRRVIERRALLRSLVGAALAAVPLTVSARLALAAGSQAASPPAASPERAMSAALQGGVMNESNAPSTPTVVLVHGAFAESSSWNGVIAELLARGYPVVAVANPLRGLQADAAYLRGILDNLSGPIVVAGHSYGGSVMSEAADGAPGVAALVYVASFNLEVGESTEELAAKFPGGQLGPALESVPVPLADGGTGVDLYIRQDQFREVFAADVAPEVARLMAATQRPIAASALKDRAARAAWRTIPSWTLVTTKDLAIPADSMRFMAARAGSTTVEIDASHAVTVSQPGVVAALIDAAARTTAT